MVAIAAHHRSLELTTSDVAAYLGVDVSSVRRWSDQGALRCRVTPGGRRRFSDADVALFADCLLRDPRDWSSSR